jgi:hypothetical protein
MTQPDHVPVATSDRVRPVERLPVPNAWLADRPGELVDLSPPTGDRFGYNASDLGYGLKLVRRFQDRLELESGETVEDAEAGVFAVGSARASLLGRAPVIYDYELAFTLFGFLGGAPEDLIDVRRKLFAGAAHDYSKQREIVDSVNEPTLRLRPVEVRPLLGSWRTLLKVA